MRLPSGLRHLRLIAAAGLATAGPVAGLPCLMLAGAAIPAPATAGPSGPSCPDGTLAQRVDCRPPGTIRVATFNASLNRATAGELRRDLATPDDPQARTVAAVIRRVRPDIVLVNEFDHDPAGAAARLFARNYLQSRNALEARNSLEASSGAPSPPLLRLPYRFSAPVNTGVPSGADLDRDGRTDHGGGDALGFGAFPGQYGMVVYSRFPLDTGRARTFQHLRWASLPGAAWPPGWYPPDVQARLPLSSKSHWDIPVKLPAGRTLHLLASHPTPPVFDGAEDRNGRRNHDEIRLWAEYLAPAGAAWVVDDQGRRGGLAPEAPFVLLGDLNADPFDGGSYQGAVRQLLDHPRVDASVVPTSAGAASAAARQRGANEGQRGDPRADTADFSDAAGAGGNLRADYVLPSRGIATCNSGVFWPTPDEPEYALVGDDTAASSDHRLVWLDLALDGPCPAETAPPIEPAPRP